MVDLVLVLLEYAKALEVRCNTLLRQTLVDAPPAVRYWNIDGQSRLVTERPLGLARLAEYLTDREVSDCLCRRLTNGGFFVSELPPVLDELAQARNKVAHQELVERDEVVRWRDLLCGVGCEGVLVRLARVGVSQSARLP
jgi:hypothetical protein